MGCSSSVDISPPAKPLLKVDRERFSTEQPVKTVFKVIIVGDSGVGKTQLLNVMTLDKYNPSSVTTIGVDFKHRVFSRTPEDPETNSGNQVDPENSVTFQFFDTAGQEKYRSITREYFRGSHAVLLCFRIGVNSTTDDIMNWYDQIREYCPTLSFNRIILAGTWSDSPGRELGTRGPFLAKPLSQCPYYEVSAKQSSFASLEKYFEDWATTAMTASGESVN